MIPILNTNEDNFEERFQAISHKRKIVNDQVSETVAKIISAIREEGDSALATFMKDLDNRDIKKISISKSRMEAAAEVTRSTNTALYESLEHMIRRVEQYHTAQMGDITEKELTNNIVSVKERLIPLKSVGAYAPSGRASYPSSLIMSVVPAKCAGVKRIVAISPNPDNPLLTAAHLLGVDEFYAIGGAQAIAALAIGTENIEPVDAICGPGNSYVTEAKKQLFGEVGIDMLAGPTEIGIIADETANPRFIAADMLAQAEHDEVAQAIAFVISAEKQRNVYLHLENLLKNLPRKDIAKKALQDCSGIVVCKSLEEAAMLANKFAPEHLEIMTENPKDLLPSVSNAGAVFLGAYSPAPLGDYMAGSNHILPTGKTTRFASALNVFFFLRRQSIIEADFEGLTKLGGNICKLADSEGLAGHKQAITIRQIKSFD